MATPPGVPWPLPSTFDIVQQRSSTIRLVLDRSSEGASRVTPELDGRSLVELVGEFETAQDWKPAGGYDGLHLNRFRFGELCEFFHGRPAWASKQLPLLGCECGEWGCWPLMASIEVGDETVTWSRFTQPHRPERDYTAFGPFTFDRDAYDLEVDQLVADTAGTRGLDG